MNTLLLMCFCSLTAICAGQTVNKDKPKNTKPASGKVTKPGSRTPAGVVVFIDPATGQIREPDPSEMATLVGRSQRPSSDAQPVTFQPPGGGVGVRLGDEFQVAAVARVATDGKLTTECTTGKHRATRRAARTSVRKSQ